MKIIIVQGGGATGKSTLAKELGRTFDISIFSKDDYRLARYAFNKTASIDWIKLEKQSYDAVYKAIEATIQDNKSLILEGNFSVSHRKDDVNEGFRDYIRYVVVVLEAICSIVGLGWYRNLGLTKNVIKLDTSYPNKIDYKPFIEFVKSIN